jgi:hypothetical protein
MYLITQEKLDRAIDLFRDCASVREVVEIVGIAKATANDIYKEHCAHELATNGRYWVNTGTNAFGIKSGRWVTKATAGETSPF